MEGLVKLVDASVKLPDTLLGTAFRGKRVLVTGHTGFKGAWLCTWLREMDARVYGHSLEPPTQPSLFDQIGLAEKMGHRIGDVRDSKSLMAAVEDFRPEVVFHLAAQTIVRESYKTPLETLDTNIMGTARVLESIRLSGRPCVFIAVTSDKCYENREDLHAYTEAEPLGGYDTYSASKGAAEIVTSAYRRAFFPVDRYASHGVAVASVRAGNVLGGGDWARDRIVPDLVRAITAGQAIEVRNPSAVRPWQHVLDALSGYLCLTARMIREGPDGLAEAWNFGPVEDTVITVGELVERVLQAWGGGEWRTASPSDTPHEAEYLRLSSQKAVKKLGWRPAFHLADTIDATIAWYKMCRESSDLYSFTVQQIRDYVSLAQKAAIDWATARRPGGG